DTGVFRLERVRGLPRAVAAFGLGLLATVFTALVSWLVLGASPLALLSLAAVVMVVSLANAAIELRGPVPVDDRPREWTAWRFVLSFAAAGAVLLLQWAGWAPFWDPSWPPRVP
ncbi:MAG TPA: hypothetical protein VEW48_15235, partial [Thermoanaerobaculia bacterium]|nr:hypothetical protein [Thermoanaerobaculia bacterium]